GDLEKLENQMVNEILGPEPADGRTGTDKAAETNLRKRFEVGRIAGTVNKELDALIYAGTNAQKIELLKSFKQKMTAEQYSELERIAKENKIISDNVIEKLEE
ncbi:MAG: hypothetical protein WC412_08330, partial [Candidatus Omnitrophota bacterium]